jgi:hypothetical protein
MKYLIFNTKASAITRTKEIATNLGCGDGAGDMTNEWFAVIEHPANLPQAALCIPSGEEDKLTTQQINQLKSYDFMKQQGWFPDIKPYQ